MKRIYVTHIVPREKTIELKVSLSATNFNYNLINGDIFAKTYSILPAFVTGKHHFEDKDNIEYIYSKWRYKNRIIGKLAPLIENILLYKRIEKNTSVWFYNVSTLNVWAMLLLLLFRRRSVQVNLIVLDFTPTDFLCKCFLPIINRCHGRICLSTSELFNKKNSFCLPGVVSIDGTLHKRITTINNDFLISGALNENIASISMLMKAFSLMPEYSLHISGGLSVNKNLIDTYTSKFKNIIFHSTLPDEEYKSLLEKVTYVLSTRNPKCPENQCNFPSKIIEALLYNKIVVSTIHYPQLDGINYFEVTSTLDGFIKDINNIVSMNEKKLLEFANQSQKIKERFNTQVWNEIMLKIEKY